MNNDTNDHTYFPSPEEAIPIIADLLIKKDFNTLAKYYDLAHSEIKLADLKSGDFFIRKERPEIAHPAEFWRYKHPFSPGFTYSSLTAGPRENVYLIRVEIVIDQGAASPSQEGYDSFYMISSAKGWQILPDVVDEDKNTEQPSIITEALASPPWKIEKI